MNESTLLKLTSEMDRQIRLGKSEELIERAVITNQAFESSGMQLDQVKRWVRDYLAKHASFSTIQKIMRSDLIYNLEDAKKIFILDRTNYQVQPMTKEMLSSIFDKKANLENKKYYCHFEYLPFTPKPLIRQEDGGWIYNSFRPPLWMTDHFYSEGKVEIKREDNVPERYKKFLWHLTGGAEESYEYILDWLANGLRNRNFCILATIGSQGIGKGRLGDIMRQLFGEHNYYEGSDKMFKGTFNAQMFNKRLVYCDEISIKKKEDEDRLKLAVNNNIEVEKKGIDAMNIANYANFYVSSNSFKSLKLTKDDRRFSIIDLTEEKLRNVMSPEEINMLDKAHVDLDKFARYLWHREVDEKKMLQPLKTETALRVLEESIPDWQMYFLNHVCEVNKGRFLVLEEVRTQLEEAQNIKISTGRAKFKEIQREFPNLFRVRTANKSEKNTRIWGIYFLTDEERENGTED